MDLGLDAEDALIAQTFRRFAERDLGRLAADADRAAMVPAELLARAGELGLGLDAVPGDHGGMLEDSYSHLHRALRGLELGRACAGLAAVLESNVEPALAVARWGSAAAKDALFGSLAAGGFAVLGFDAGDRLRLGARGGDLTLAGPLGPLPVLARASHVLVLTRAEPAIALVALAGLAPRALTPSGWRAAAWAELELDVVVPAAFVLARGDAARAAIAEIRAWQHASLAARAVGVATAAIEHAARYGKDRVQFGQPIGTFESLARLRDDHETHIAAARAFALQAAWELDRALPSALDTASRARVLAAEVVGRATIDAVQMFGGYGFVNDFPVEKLMRDARAFEVLGGNEALARVLDRGEKG